MDAKTDAKVFITREDFKEAIVRAMENIINDDKVEGMAKFAIPLAGNMFAREMETILFGEEEEEEA